MIRTICRWCLNEGGIPVATPVRKSRECRFRSRRCQLPTNIEDTVDWPRARNEINANPLELILRGEWLNGGGLFWYAPSVTRRSRAAQRAVSMGLITLLPPAVSFPPATWRMLFFPRFITSWLDYYRLFRKRAPPGALTNNAWFFVAAAGVVREVVSQRSLFLELCERTDKFQSTPSLFFMTRDYGSLGSIVAPTMIWAPGWATDNSRIKSF